MERLYQDILFPTGKDDYPMWICADCGNKYGHWPDGHIGTFSHGLECGWCGEIKTVTEPRDYRYPPHPKDCKEQLK